MTRPLIFTLLAMLISPVYATDLAPSELAKTQQFIDGLIANPPSPAQQQVASALGQQASGQLNDTDRQWAQSLARQQQAAAGAKPVPQALYFVSFAIPQTGLKRLILDADRFGIPATLRGMVNNDMRQTANAVLQLVNEDQRGGVQIDPMSFRRYGINAVPALVVTCGDTFDRIAGNLALQAALTKVAESGECAETAKAILAAHP